jgi:DNA-binding MarR family transcriptional regulator
MSHSPAAPAPNPCTASRVRRASRRISQIYDRHLEPYEVSITQFGILAQLRAHPGVGVSALAERMIMDSTTLSRNLRPLERRGLVACEIDRDDGRARKLRLTPTGRALVERATNGWSAAQRQIEQALGAEGMQTLNATLDRALDRLVD